MKKFFAEFKEFISRGNVVDMAVGVIVGAAFKAIIDSLTADVISPAIGIFANTDFSNLVWDIGGAQIKYGSFITAVINFLIMSFVIFLLVKFINKLRNIGKKPVAEVAADPTTKICPFCKSEVAIDATRCPHCTSLLS